MKKPAFNALLKSISDAKTKRIDRAKAAALDAETKRDLVHHIVRARSPIITEFLGGMIEDSWLYAMGYSYRYHANGFDFVGTIDHHIAAAARSDQPATRPVKLESDTGVDLHGWIDEINWDFDDAGIKALFHRRAKSILKQLATQLRLRPADYDLKVNPAGPAVMGEVMLQSDRLFVQISIYSCELPRVLYRSCRSRSDHSSGGNRWCHARDLTQATRLAEMAGYLAPNTAQKAA